MGPKKIFFSNDFNNFKHFSQLRPKILTLYIYEPSATDATKAGNHFGQVCLSPAQNVNIYINLLPHCEVPMDASINEQELAFMRYVKLPQDYRKSCWAWQGPTQQNQATLFERTAGGGRKKIYAIRRSYQLFIGDIPPGYIVTHICKNVLCVNPYHLKIVKRLNNTKKEINYV